MGDRVARWPDGRMAVCLGGRMGGWPGGRVHKKSIVFESDMYRTFCYIDRCTVDANVCW